MNNIFVYCEVEDGVVADVSLELLTKGRSLSNELKCQLEAVVVGGGLKDVESQIIPFGVDVLHIIEDPRLSPYTTAPHAAVLIKLFEEEKPQRGSAHNCNYSFTINDMAMHSESGKGI